MTVNAASVLDASALLAYLGDESGAEVVESALMQGSVISVINWAEVLTKLAERGQNPDAVNPYSHSSSTARHSIAYSAA